MGFILEVEVNTIGEILPRAIEVLKARAQLPPNKRGGTIAGAIQHLRAIIMNQKPPNEGWLACINNTLNAICQANGSAEKVLALLRETVRQLLIEPAKAAVKAGQTIDEQVRKDLEAIIDLSGTDPAVITEARTLLYLTEQNAQQVRLANLANRLTGHCPEVTLTTTTRLYGRQVRVEVQPVVTWSGNGKRQRRIKVTDTARNIFTVWAVQEDGCLHMCCGEGLAGVNQSKMVEATLTIVDAILNQPAPASPSSAQTNTRTAKVGNNGGRWAGLPDFEVVCSRLGSTKDLPVEIDGITTVTRQEVGEQRGERCLRLRFQKGDGFTIVSLSETGKVFYFPNGRVQMSRQMVTEAMQALAAKFTATGASR